MRSFDSPMFQAAVRLAALLSLVAVVVVLALDSLGDVSTAGLVGVVAVVGFSTSWVLTGRVARPVPVTAGRVATHRVAVVPLPHRV